MPIRVPVRFLGVRGVICISSLLALIAGVEPAVAAVPAVGDGDGGFRLTPVLEGKPGAIDVAATGATPKALYVATQGGRIRVVRGGEPLKRPFLAISRLVKVGFEEGLLSLAFHPRYARNGLLYVWLTNKKGDDVLMEYRRSDDDAFRADHASGRRVLTVRHPYIDRHNGGELAFGPDGLLYLSVGDGSFLDEERRSQARGSLLGKILRIDPRRVRPCEGRLERREARREGQRCGPGRRPYTSPPRNPFSGATPGRAEVYALGFRNPFRFSFDALTGAISIGDVGESCREEVDYRLRGRARGANFGWSRFEGTQELNTDVEAPGAIPPIFEYGHGPGGPCLPAASEHTGAAVVVGHVVRDRRLAGQYGRLLFADWANGDIRTLIPAEGGAVDEQSSGVTVPQGVISFGQGTRRRIYVIGRSGTVYRLDPA
jgi:glucose/arabinose dehydrogenase